VEIARLVVELLKATAWPITLISVAFIFRKAISSALQQRDVHFEALGMNVEITRQAEAATEALGATASESATPAVQPNRGSTPSEALPKDRLGSAGRRALEGFPDTRHTYILMSDPTAGLLGKWNEINEAIRSVQDAFELGWRTNWPMLMVRATGNENWGDLGRSWSRIRGAMSLVAQPIGSHTGPWRLREGAPPVADEVARLLMDSMGVLYDRLLSEVHRLATVDRVPEALLDLEHGPATAPTPSG
jgi:hypothetical protein